MCVEKASWNFKLVKKTCEYVDYIEAGRGVVLNLSIENSSKRAYRFFETHSAKIVLIGLRYRYCLASIQSTLGTYSSYYTV